MQLPTPDLLVASSYPAADPPFAVASYVAVMVSQVPEAGVTASGDPNHPTANPSVAAASDPAVVGGQVSVAAVPVAFDPGVTASGTPQPDAPHNLASANVPARSMT